MRTELRVLARRWCAMAAEAAAMVVREEEELAGGSRVCRCIGEDGGGAAVRTKMVDNGRRWRRDDGGAAMVRATVCDAKR